ncbi:ABC transporter ATP-binding protein [Bradyrhizobium sp. cf659]|uniref:ABC transporter ATP-binding protein n=1 Tax=Bradyrhizobium sp. cf659 TaxID=1761771 RepID=UPI0008EF8B1A|nr:ATP-binding cassette domain-containing protein [Bradyrhizobium sp. cf659]SFK16070.1 amino acid/amide ABC transporter ATP-binding protein 1, HAAT family [Bradyrhizobium sp. cf659]
MASPLLFACSDITLDLGGRSILHGISLSVEPGEVLGVIGPNGAGKTSLFEVLSGRIPPKSGSIRYRGKDITSLPLHRRAQLGIGRTYQTPVVPEGMTVAQVLKAARQAYRPYLTPDDSEWGAGLVAFHVPSSTMADQLETLNRRKLLMTCLLMRRPKILLMDEPAAGLINSEIDEFDEIMRVLAKELDIAIVLIEHRMELLDTIADRVMVLDAGEMIAEGRLDQILVDPRVKAAYFELDGTH